MWFVCVVVYTLIGFCARGLFWVVAGRCCPGLADDYFCITVFMVDEGFLYGILHLLFWCWLGFVFGFGLFFCLHGDWAPTFLIHPHIGVCLVERENVELW